MSLITIDQLLASVDLDFEPRWVTKDESGLITIWADKPSKDFASNVWIEQTDFVVLPRIKLADFADKHWQECIYEVPRKTTKIEKIEVGYNNSLKVQDWQDIGHTVANKINELVDAVNELKAKFALPALKTDLTDEDLRKMMCDPKYWRDKDPEITQKVQNGFNKLYGDKN